MLKLQDLKRAYVRKKWPGPFTQASVTRRCTLCMRALSCTSTSLLTAIFY